jgi:large subunit ribosomal protein L12e
VRPSSLPVLALILTNLISAAVKEMLGTAQSLGCTVDGRPAHDIIEAIDAGEIEIPSE